MNSHLMPFLVVWVVLAVVVLVLLAWRKVVTSHEDDTLHVAEPDAVQEGVMREQAERCPQDREDRQVGQNPHHNRGGLWPDSGERILLPDVDGEFQHRSVNQTMTNRALSRLGLRLGSALLGLMFSERPAPIFAPRKPPELRFLPRPGAEAGQERAQGAALREFVTIPTTSIPIRPIFPSRIAPPAIPARPAITPAAYTARRVRTATKARRIAALCHGSAHELLPPKSQAFRAAVPDTCGMCHSAIAEQYRASVHGQALARGVTQAPLCTDCHGEHKILKHTNAASTVNGPHIRDTCGSCHGDVRLTRKFGLPSDRLVSFDSSFHGLAAKAGSQTVANCASCHGVHNILPSSDPRSTINPKNLPKTCGQCHPGAGTRFAISQVHVSEGAAEPAVLRVVREFYLLLIPVTIGLMLLHQAGDWVRKLIAPALRRRRGASPRPAHGGLRMLPFERRGARGDGGVLHRAGVDRFRPQVSGPVVGAPAADDGRGAHPCAA